MKLSNRRNILITLYFLMSITVIDVICLVFLEMVFAVNKYILYSGFFTIFTLAIWRILVVKTFSIEISKYILSINYAHPLVQKSNIPVLEIPLQKIASCKIKKNAFRHFLYISIHTRRGVKSFQFKLGILHGEQADYLKKILLYIKFYSKNETEL